MPGETRIALVSLLSRHFKYCAQHVSIEWHAVIVIITRGDTVVFPSVGVLLLLFLLMSIPVVMLGIGWHFIHVFVTVCVWVCPGAAYHGQCSVEPLIPIFLIVAGVCGVIKSAETLIKQMVVCCKLSKTISQHPKLKYLMLVWRVIDFVFNLALFAWFIAGSYWVFHVYAGLQAADFDEKLCHPVLYKCAFGIMICNYILLCTTCGCVCALSCCRKKHSTEEERPGRGSTSPECEASREEETGCSSPCTGDGVPLAASQVAIDVLPEEDTGSHQQSVDRTCSDTEL